MFYYPNVLQRHSGCFSTIWLAATKGVKVTRRELLGVNVKRTCLDILNYVTAQVPPPQQNMPKPRFSLYLSSQLQYGVVVVYHRQCGFLLDEIQQTIDRLLRSKKCIPIDMAESDRMALDLHDNLLMMEQAEAAQDPFFGLMESHQLPSPYKVHQPGLLNEDLSSDLSLVPSPHTASDAGFRLPPAAITLTEKEQFVIATAEHFEGADLLEATNREIDLLMDEQIQFRQDFVEQQRDGRERSRDLMSSLDQLRETVLGTHRDSVLLQDEGTGQLLELPAATLPQEMTPVQVNMPSSPSGTSEKEREQSTESSLGEVIPRPVRKPGGLRKRQLVFADPEVQISNKAMKEQIENPRAETLNLSEVLLDLVSVKWASPVQLFNSPCGTLIHYDLQSLWDNSAFLTALSGPEDQLIEVEDAAEEQEQDREILRTERKRRQSTMKEISSDSALQPAEGSSALDVILDMSKEDKSVSDAITPGSRCSPQEEVLLGMEPIAEENIEMPEAQTDPESSDMLSWICSSLRRFGEVTFDSLLPPGSGRTSAAHALNKLLELLSAGHVMVQQVEPYDKIIINTTERMSFA